MKAIAEVHDTLERAASINKIDAGTPEQLLQLITDVHFKLSTLAATAGEQAGEKNADST